MNNEVITQKDLNDFANFIRIQLSREYKKEEVENKVRTMEPDLLNKLIEDRLILQEGKKNDYKIEISPKNFISIKPDENRIKARLNEIKKRYPSELEFQQDLARQGLVQADIEGRIREQLLMYNIIEYKIRDKILVSPEEVTDFYNKNLPEFVSQEGREVEVITLENEDLARSFSYSLRIGQKLEDLVARYPIVTVDRVIVSKGEELRKDIEEVVFKLGIREVSEPVKIEEKYYIFRLNNIMPPRKQILSEVQDKIHTYLFEKKMQESLSIWLDELKAKSYIKK